MDRMVYTFYRTMGVNNNVIKPVYDLLKNVILLPTTQKELMLSRSFFI